MFEGLRKGFAPSCRVIYRCFVLFWQCGVGVLRGEGGFTRGNLQSSRAQPLPSSGTKCAFRSLSFSPLFGDTLWACAREHRTKATLGLRRRYPSTCSVRRNGQNRIERAVGGGRVSADAEFRVTALSFAFRNCTPTVRSAGFGPAFAMILKTCPRSVLKGAIE